MMQTPPPPPLPRPRPEPQYKPPAAPASPVDDKPRLRFEVTFWHLLEARIETLTIDDQIILHLVRPFQPIHDISKNIKNLEPSLNRKNLETQF